MYTRTDWDIPQSHPFAFTASRFRDAFLSVTRCEVVQIEACDDFDNFTVTVKGDRATHLEDLRKAERVVFAQLAVDRARAWAQGEVWIE